MKNFLLLTCLLAFAANCLFAANEAVKPEGDGTAESPYILTRIENIVWMGDNIADCKSSVFCLGNDIDASETEYWESQFIPIGMPKTTYGLPTDFGGVFDGNNYAIKGLHSRDANAFIRSLRGAKVSNLYLEDVKFCFSGTGAGGLAIYCDGSVVTNVHVSGKIEGATYVGGVCGNVDGSQIVNCSFIGFIVGFGAGSFGGVVGESTFSDISYCKASGYIDNDKEDANIGGICGTAVANDSYSRVYPRIRYCIADMKITAKGNIGGIVAQNYIQNVRREAFGDVVIENRGLIDNYSLCVADSSLATTEGGICAAFGETSIDIYDNFYDRTGTSGTVFGKGLSPENMKRKASFTNWDFEKVWTIREWESTPYWTICNDKPYRVVCFSNFSGTLSITPEEKSYAFNENVTINILTPENGVFIGFKEGLENTETNISFKLTRDLIVVGEFAKYIRNADDFLKIGRSQDYPIDGHYIQTSDIDMSETDYPIPVDFQGIYDGGNHTIRNIVFDKYYTHVGLFSRVSRAKISNLEITDAEKCFGNYIFGFLGGEVTFSEISNCYVRCDLNAHTTAGGGLCGGMSSSKMVRCNYRGNINYEGGDFGGLVGWSTDCIFEECSAEFYGQPNDCTVGGFVASGGKDYFANCYVKSDCLDYAFALAKNVSTYSNCYVFAENECVLFQANYFNCYFSSNCVATVEGITGFVSEEEMKKQETYEGWDFDEIWDIDEGVGTPYFRYAVPEPVGMLALLLLAFMAMKKR